MFSAASYKAKCAMYLVNNYFHWLLDSSTLQMKYGADPSGRAVCDRPLAGIMGLSFVNVVYC